jgi:hypothetical protein
MRWPARALAPTTVRHIHKVFHNVSITCIWQRRLYFKYCCTAELCELCNTLAWQLT